MPGRVSRRLWVTLALGIASVLSTSSPCARASETSGPQDLKRLSLEELSNIEVTTLSKEPEKASQVPSAIYVITGDDIRHSGVTTIAEALRLAPGVEVARIDRDKWAIGMRGFGSRYLVPCWSSSTDAPSIHAAVRRDLLGSAGHAARGYRPHRSHPRPRRHHLGSERGQRRHQYHHQAHPRHPRHSGFGWRRQRRAGLRKFPLRRRRRKTSTVASTPRDTPAITNTIRTIATSTTGAAVKAASGWIGLATKKIISLSREIFTKNYSPARVWLQPVTRSLIRRPSMPTLT